MNACVVDASVIVKWIIPDPETEAHVEQALAVLLAVREGRLSLVQPPHWLAEVAAVLVRLRPAVADQAIGLLSAMQVPVMADIGVYLTAAALARDLQHHLFDTLYHAVALQTPEAVLVTADEAYYRKAHGRGRLRRLAEWA